MMATKIRSLGLGISGMESPPVNELGVVCLFTLMHRRLGVRGIKRIRARFPDCIAIQRDGTREREARIEFEFKSSHFRRHKHSARVCDYIICWEHDWIHAPESLQGKVIELRKWVDMARDVWFQPIGEEYWEWHDQTREKTGRWLGPPAGVKKGDLVLYYCTSPRSYVDQVCLLTGDPAPDRNADRWKHSIGIKVLARLANPITCGELKMNRVLRGATFVKANFLGQFRATPWWPSLYQLIVAKNHSVRRALRGHSPDTF